MKKQIPNLTFRIEPGYVFEKQLSGTFKFMSNNLVIGSPTIKTKLNSIFLGRVAEYGEITNVWLDYEGAHAIYVMGKRRSGKTYTLGVIIEGLASSNWIRQGNQKQAILMLDTMNVFITMPHIVEEVYDEQSMELKVFRKWKLQSEAFNIVLFYPRGYPKPPEGISKDVAIRPADLSDTDWAALFGLDTYSNPMGQLIADLYEKVVLEGYVDLNKKQIDSKKNYSINDLLNCLSNCEEINISYHPETIRAIKTKFKSIKRLPIFSKSGVDIKEIFLPGQLSILLLRDIDQNLRSLLVGILVKKIMEFRSISDRYERLAVVQKERFESLKEKGDKKKAKKAFIRYKQYEQETDEGLPRGWIIIDEAHNYMPTKGITPSRKPLLKYVNEGRNLGLSIVMATQNPSALDLSIRRNADILIIHSISMKDDITTAQGMLNTFLPDSFGFKRKKILKRVFEQLVRSLPIGYAVISNDGINRVFVTKIRPRITVHGGKEY